MTNADTQIIGLLTQIQAAGGGGGGGTPNDGSVTDAKLSLTTPNLATPSAIVLTNASGTAASLTAGHVTTNANLTGDVTSVGNATTLANIPAIAGTNLTGTAANLTAGTASAVAVGGITGLGTGVATALAANVGSAGAPVTFNGALGTPSGGTLTSCSGLPVEGITASTSTAIGVGTIELGHATDTTIARSGSGAITVEGVQVLLSGAALGTPASGTVTNLTGTASININGTVGATTPGTGAFTTLTNTGAATNSKSGAASTPALLVSGVPFAGTGTTSFPLLYVNDANATASTTLSTAGTYLGVNGDGTQDLMNLLKDGVSQFKIGSNGALTTTGSWDISGAWRFNNSTGSFSPLASTTAFSLGTTALPWGGMFVKGPIVATTPQALSGAGAVDITSLSTAFTSTGGAQALTLADGTNGQIKTISHVVDGGSGVLTPTTKSGYSTITFTNVGDSVTLQFFTTAGWCIVGIFGATTA